MGKCWPRRSIGTARQRLDSCGKGSDSAGRHLRLGSPGGAEIARFTPSTTGGWGIYEEQSLNIVETSGVHDLYLVAEGAPVFVILIGCSFPLSRFTSPTTP
jgi:Carbohydrate binding module (family 6).